MKFEPDMEIKTHDTLNSTDGMVAHSAYLACRRAGAEGELVSVLPGHGGDVWLVSHGKYKAVYSIDEMTPCT